MDNRNNYNNVRRPAPRQNAVRQNNVRRQRPVPPAKYRERVNTERLFVLAVIAAALVLLIVVFISSVSASDDSYKIKTPTVYQGETLDDDDFIEVVRAFSGCRAKLPVSATTEVPGTHTVTVSIEGNGGYTHTVECTYNVIPVLRDSLVIEAGSGGVSISDLVVDTLTEDEFKKLSPKLVGELPRTDVPGEYRVDVLVSSSTLHVTVTVADTIPPTATPVDITINNESSIPVPEDFVTDITDATSVVASFGGEYVFTEPGEFDVDIILTDAVGNTSTITSHVNCNIDRTPPVFGNLPDLYVTVGGTVSYKDGVTVTDDSGEATYTVDAGGADTSALGDYVITYTATDKYGNSSTATRMLYVVEKMPPDEAEVMALAREVYDKYIIKKDNMTKWDIAYAIWDWSYHAITYTGSSDKSSWLQGAYDGYKNRSGDCYTYMAVAKSLLTIADIPHTIVQRQRISETESRHYWLLVDIGDGWYHFDSCQRRLCREFKAFMRTDAELQWYCDNYDEHYYRFDHSAYPERATESYYEGLPS